MRNPVIFLALLAALGLVACEQKVDVAAEEEAIKAVIQHEMDVWIALDYEGWAATWVHAPYVIHRGRSGDPVGWDSLNKEAKKTLEEWKELIKNEPDKYRSDELTASNFDIYLNGNIAFVIHDEHFEVVWEGENRSGDTKGVIKYLEKKDGEWKLVAVL